MLVMVSADLVLYTETMAKNSPDFQLEAALMVRGYASISGVDEVGRGPLAGPVTACAVRLDASRIPPGLNDSKKLSAAKRYALYSQILASADVCVAHASVAEIDELNILRASQLAMCRALTGLKYAPDYALIDGNLLPQDLTLPALAVIKGDGKSLSIAAASIVAKVVRDQIMVDLGQEFPGYGWAKNAGYPTKAHFAGLQNLGVTPHHRRSFKPIHNILYQDI